MNQPRSEAACSSVPLDPLVGRLHVLAVLLASHHREHHATVHAAIDEIERMRDGIGRCYRMLLSDPDTKGALFKAENILREALAGANAKTHNTSLHSPEWSAEERRSK